MARERVAASRLGSQPVGAAAEVAEGVYQLKLPVPFPLEFISVYLVRGDTGWTAIDAGFDYPAAREAWERGGREIGLDLDAELDRIIITHLHPDHVGAAHWLHERSGAPVYMLEGEIENARHLWEGERTVEDFVRYLTRHGMQVDLAEPTAGSNRFGIRLPELNPLRPGERLDLGGLRAEVIHVPGHSDYQFMLHDPERELLLAADHVLLEITPNIGLWTYTEPQPLDRYLKSLEGLRGLRPETVLPAHGPVFHDLDGRIDELLAHHEERLEVTHEAFDGEPETSYAIARRVFREGLTDHQLRFALAETLAHLEHLVLQGRAERIEGAVVTYRAL
jgi:glyoxylase-like metal-dependent hydrolase (beta-lactamase superfamily II)